MDYDHILTLIDMLRKNSATCTITVKTASGMPIEGVSCTNILSSSGDAVTTDANGLASGTISAKNGFTPIFYEYTDIESFSSTPINAQAGLSYSISVVATVRNFIRYDASKNIRFSKNCQKISFCLVGGGGSGGISMSSYAAAGGGGGGGVTKIENITPPYGISYSLNVGMGGSSVGYGTAPTNGRSGGTTSYWSYSAPGGGGGGGALGYGTNPHGAGGSGGPGGGNGGYLAGEMINVQTTNGENGSVPYYTSFTNASEYGPGGGGSATAQINTSSTSYLISASPGMIGGGSGGVSENKKSEIYYRNPTSGTNGGGGGAGAWREGSGQTSAAGGNGFAVFRMQIRAS